MLMLMSTIISQARLGCDCRIRASIHARDFRCDSRPSAGGRHAHLGIRSTSRRATRQRIHKEANPWLPPGRSHRFSDRCSISNPCSMSVAAMDAGWRSSANATRCPAQVFARAKSRGCRTCRGAILGRVRAEPCEAQRCRSVRCCHSGAGRIPPRQSHWVDLFDGKGFDTFGIFRSQLWDRADISVWCKQNMLLYVNRSRKDLVARVAGYIEANRITQMPGDVVHPERYDRVQAAAAKASACDGAQVRRRRAAPDLIPGMIKPGMACSKDSACGLSATAAAWPTGYPPGTGCPLLQQAVSC